MATFLADLVQVLSNTIHTLHIKKVMHVFSVIIKVPLGSDLRIIGCV